MSTEQSSGGKDPWGRFATFGLALVAIFVSQFVAVAIFSYNGQLNFGYLADQHGMPDVDVVAAGVEESVRELLDAAKSRLTTHTPAKRLPGTRKSISA